LRPFCSPSSFRGEPRDLVAELKWRGAFRFPGFWTLQAAGWGCVTLSSVIADLPSIRDVRTLQYSGSFLIWAFAASLVLRFVCRSLVRRGLPWMALELWAFLWCMPTGATAGFLAELTGRGPFTWFGWIETSIQTAFILFAWCSLYFSIKMWQQSTEGRERLLRAEAELRDAKLNALRYQLNPHFLFNSLNAVSTLVLEGNSVAATRMLAQIGDLLRSILDGEAKLELPLSEEIAFIEQYLAIEQTRLGPRLRTDVSIAPDTLDALVPSLLLQPLVENAVRHGVAPQIEGSEVRISSALVERRLQITVWNTGPVHSRTVEQREPAAGIGLSNTVERLNALYPGEHQFLLEWPPSGGCRVSVELPFRRSETESESRSCAS
jgi:two-component system LytT family sensor kinase